MNLVFFLLLVLTSIVSHVYGIMGGTNATTGDILHSISIRSIILDSQTFGSGHYCGAGLLTDQTILTAAHCILDFVGDKYMEAGYMRVVGGTLNKDLMEAKSFESSCIAIKPHPGFNFKSRAFDLAVIRFKSAVPKTVNLIPITLGSSLPTSNDTCKVVSWGRTSPGSHEPIYPIAITAEVKMMDMTNCQKMYMGIPDNMICFGATGVAICRGDLGSLVYCNDEAVGIISISETCTNSTELHPFLATSIPVFAKWIGQHKDGAFKSHMSSICWLVLLILCTLILN